MKRRRLALIVTVLASLVVAATAYAAAPAAGTVYEGRSVPGIQLGATRAEVEAAFGEPLFCQSVEAAGDLASCSFPVDGGGQVDVRYRGADGGNAANSPDDLARVVRWHEQVSGWTSTAGVNTALAKADPDAAAAAYPEAQITYNMFGDIYRLVDAEQGIEIVWALDFYNGTTHVSMAIFEPRPPAPEPVPETHVVGIDLSAGKGKGQREVRALVQVRNEREVAAVGAVVRATWTLPDGSTVAAQGETSSSGYAYFELASRLGRGTYTLTVDDVVLADHSFNAAGSVLSASIRVK